MIVDRTSTTAIKKTKSAKKTIITAFSVGFGHAPHLSDPVREYPTSQPKHLFPVYPFAQVPVKSLSDKDPKQADFKSH